MAKILVVCEQIEGKLKKASLSAITFARKLLEKTSGGYDLLVIGEGAKGVAKSLTGYGAEKVYVVESEIYKNYLAQSYSHIIKEIAERSFADFICAATTTFSKDCLPRVAAKLNAGMASDVISVNGPPLRFKRLMWAGNVVGVVEVTTPKAVFTVRSTEFPQADETDGCSQIEEVLVPPPPSLNARFVEFLPSKSERPELTEAKVVVAGGRGLRDKDGFKIIEPLADLFNAAIGGTRAVVDAGILSNDLQIGQTGKVIAPDLYFGIALSGAIQHLAGMKNSKVIVAINKDEEAPIFSIADYGLVADAFKSLPELVEEIKKIKR